MFTDPNQTSSGFENIERLFHEVLRSYPEIAPDRITVVRKKMNSTTMRAQPVVDRRFFNKMRRTYKVEVAYRTKMDPSIKVEDMPDDVIKGWFAHEFGHVVDYLNRSAVGLLVFGVCYLIFRFYRVGAERVADVHAIQHGFPEEVVETKKYILEHSIISSRYKKQIERYYMSPEEVAIVIGEIDGFPEENDAGVF